MIKKLDWVFLSAALGLIGIGLIMGLSTSSVVGFMRFDDSFYLMKRQLVYVVLGLIAMGGAAMVPMSVYRKTMGWGFVVSMGLLVLALVPGLGVTLGGATRWLNLGVIQVQPIEIVKFFLSGIVAICLVNKGEQLRSFSSGLVPVLIVIALPVMVLAKQPDLGNIILITAVTGSLLLVAPTRLIHLVGIGVSVVSLVGVSIMAYPYQRQRILSFLDPWADPLGKNYHIVQSMTAIGSGGFFGLGLGQSKLKYFYLPLHYSDFIFAIVCEEGGFLLGGFVIVLFFMMLYRVLMTVKALDSFTHYFVLALTLFLAVQAFLNIGVVVGVLPVTGIPLTFISFGGTSLVISMASVGVVVRGLYEGRALSR